VSKTLFLQEAVGVSGSAELPFPWNENMLDLVEKTCEGAMLLPP
jgi:hypothetical protein